MNDRFGLDQPVCLEEVGKSINKTNEKLSLALIGKSLIIRPQYYVLGHTIEN